MGRRVTTPNSATPNSQVTPNSQLPTSLLSGAIPAGDRSGSALPLRHVEKPALRLEVRDPRGDLAFAKAPAELAEARPGFSAARRRPTSSPHAAAPLRAR